MALTSARHPGESQALETFGVGQRGGDRPHPEDGGEEPAEEGLGDRRQPARHRNRR